MNIASHNEETKINLKCTPKRCVYLFLQTHTYLYVRIHQCHLRFIEVTKCTYCNLCGEIEINFLRTLILVTEYLWFLFLFVIMHTLCEASPNP